MTRARGLLLAFGLLLLPRASEAQVTLIDQLEAVPAFGSSGLSDSDCTFGTPHRAAARAEDFVVLQAVSVSTVDFQGDYAVNPAPSDPESFVIRFHGDSAGLPGAVVAEPAPAVTQSLLLGSNTSVYGFTATFSAVVLDPGSYWVEIVETDSSTPECFGWHSGVHDTAHSADGSAVDLNAAPGASWSLQTGTGTNFAVRILGTPAATDSGTVQFSSPAYSIGETGASAVITLTRVGGTDGQIMVRFRTVAGGTATPIDDYVAAEALLTWTDGDGSDQTVSVEIEPDDIAEGPETILMVIDEEIPALRAPGPVRALPLPQIGNPSMAVLTILDDDGAAVAVPTLSQWAMAALAALLAVTAWWRLRAGP
jgi:hypothetical protein